MLAAVSASAALRVLLLSDHLERKTQRRRWACAGSRLRPSESLGSGPQRRSCPRCWRGNRVGLHSVQRIGDTPGKPIYACFLHPLKGHDAPKPRDCCSIVSSRVSEPGATLNPRLQTLSAQEQAICAIKSAIKTAATSSHRFEMWAETDDGLQRSALFTRPESAFSPWWQEPTDAAELQSKSRSAAAQCTAVRTGARALRKRACNTFLKSAGLFLAHLC